MIADNGEGFKMLEEHADRCVFILHSLAASCYPHNLAVSLGCIGPINNVAWRFFCYAFVGHLYNVGASAIMICLFRYFRVVVVAYFLFVRLMHSVATQKKLKTQNWAIKNPRKPKVKFLYVFGKFLEKIALFLKKANFSWKNVFLSAKIFWWPFFFSHRLWFLKLFTLVSQILTIFRQKCLTFCKKQQKNVFSG